MAEYETLLKAVAVSADDGNRLRMLNVGSKGSNWSSNSKRVVTNVQLYIGTLVVEMLCALCWLDV